MKSTRLLLLSGLLLALPAIASAQSPLSAIDWLSDSIRQPETVLPQPVPDQEPTGALPGPVTVQPIEGPRPDAVGLLPLSVTGLPADLWQGSSTSSVAARFRSEKANLIPATQDLYYLLLLAELDPPSDASAKPDLLLARVDALLALGAVEQAGALIERTGSNDPEVFRRKFDIALLLQDIDPVCAQMRSSPSISPTFTARVYCLARGGDWSGAALSLETGRALGFVSDAEDQLLAHFLDLGLDEDTPPLPLPERPTPLEFRIYEAIGRPLPTSGLPLAFAHSDLHSFSGWKAQISAAERLVKHGALDPNRLWGLYTEQKPAASGGVWERAKSIQGLDASLLSFDPAYLGPSVLQAWEDMSAIELEVPFSRTYCARLIGRHLTGDAAHVRFVMCMLAGTTPDQLTRPASLGRVEELALAITTGDLANAKPVNAFERAIVAGFAANRIPTRLQSLVQDGRKGEAALRSIDLLSGGATGDLDELTDALAFLRLSSFTETARRAVIELLFLERRG